MNHRATRACLAGFLVLTGAMACDVDPPATPTDAVRERVTTTDAVMESRQPTAPPELVWAAGTVTQILVQPGEEYYVFAIRETDGSTSILRIGDAHTGHSLRDVGAENLVYDLPKEAHFRNLAVEVGYRDFGFDPQSGGNRLVIDRVSLVR